MTRHTFCTGRVVAGLLVLVYMDADGKTYTLTSNLRATEATA